MWKVPLTSNSRSLLVALLAALLLLGACTDDPEAGGNNEEAETAGPEAPPFCPMTGEDPPKGVKLIRPALALKIENSPEARPQRGLDQADIVYEEIVEGGATRFMAIYHCHDAAKGGPVRSARFDDPKIAKPFTRILAYSGANLIVQNEIKKQKLIPLHEQNASGALFRVPAGSTDVHSLFGDTRKLRQLGAKKRKLEPPGSAYFKFDDAPKGGKAKSVTLKFNPNVEISWRWKGGKWRRFEDGARFLTAGGKQIATNNLLVQEVEVNDSKTIVDVAGNPSPDIALDGKGRAFLFRDGEVVKGTWKAGKDGVPKFKTKDGDPFTFDVGSTWIELVPSKKGSVKGSIAFSKK